MKNFTFLNTDFYQISMAFAYVVEGLNTQKTGFEGFVRHVKPVINPNKNFYIFDGEAKVKEYMETVRKELRDPELCETIIALVSPKITAPNKDELIERFRKNWKSVDANFEYSVVPNGTIVFPLVPVFQFSGDKMVGQVIETYVTNIYNGRTGLATLNYFRDTDDSTISNDEHAWLLGIIENDERALEKYAKVLDSEAKKFRNATDKILLEAAFRRAPTFEAARIASKVAIKNGWNGTSNVSTVLSGELDDSKIGGTMAHSWVMCFKNEDDSFRLWDKIFPGTTMLIDTYDVARAARSIKAMIDAGEISAPKDVRIDSDPLDVYAKEVNEIFGGTVNVYVSGDMDVEKFEAFKADGVPYSKSMAGTKYVYADETVAKLNCGFVYKIVQYTDENGDIVKPEKKSTGKSNYAGLKFIRYNVETDTVTVDYSKNNTMLGFIGIKDAKPSSKVEFK